MEVLKIVPEGMGALFGQALPKKLTVIDFGNGTTLYSRYTQGKREVHTPHPTPRPEGASQQEFLKNPGEQSNAQ